MAMNNPAVPLGIYLAWKLFHKDLSLQEHRSLVLILTFVAYACFHASRKPLSVVKGVLDPDGGDAGVDDGGSDAGWASLAPSPAVGIPLAVKGWAPFEGPAGAARLGELDVAFLASYAIGMYFAGRIGDRIDLRKFLSIGMLASGAVILFFGMGYWWNLHSFPYYFLVQIASGLLSSIGWPCVVAIVGNWFGKTKRGLIMGIWNAHASVGNIVGSIVAAYALRFGWGWAFVLPALAIMTSGAVVFLFLIVEPASLGLPSPHEVDHRNAASDDEAQHFLLTPAQTTTVPDAVGDASSTVNVQVPISFGADWDMIDPLDGEELPEVKDHATLPPKAVDKGVSIGFAEAWRIPGVAQYAFCLFFVKLVAYTFLFWLPFYIKHTAIAGRHLSDKAAGYLSTIFDIGGVIGGIIAGHLSDRYNVNAIIAVVLVYCAVPSLYLFRVYGGVSVLHTVVLMIISGIFVNGPYALITTAVSADLGTHSSLKGNARALATVTAIIDGTGSVGAAIGPFLTGYVSVQSWNAVFMMLAGSSLVGGLFLMQLAMAEIVEKLNLYRGNVVSGSYQQEMQEIVR